MDLEDFTTAVYCPIDEPRAELTGDPDWGRVRSRGPALLPADVEVLMEVGGEFLGLD